MVRDPADQTRLRTAVGAPGPVPAADSPALPAGPSGTGEAAVKKDVAKKDKDGSGWSKPKLTSVLAGAGAAATSTLIGGHLGAAGTVIGAALASIITTLALNIYENTLRNGVHRIRGAWKRDGDRAVPGPGATGPHGTAVTRVTFGEEEAFGADDATEDAAVLTRAGGRLPVRISRRMVVVSGLTALLATLLGLGVMVGLEHGSATPITPGTSQLAGTGSSAKSTGSDSSTTTQNRQSDTTTGTDSGTGTATTTAKATPSTVATPAHPSASSAASTGTSGGTSGTTSGGTTSGTSGSDTTSGSGTSGSSGTTGGTTGSGTTGSTTGQ